MMRVPIRIRRARFHLLGICIRSFSLKAGVNNLYIGGRSKKFGIHRISVY